MSSKKQKVAPGGDVERAQKQCLNVLRAMQRNPDAAPFLVPVDWKALKLSSYPKIVKVCERRQLLLRGAQGAQDG